MRKPEEQEELLQQMRRMEQRYAYEDTLMAMVEQGRLQELERLGSFSDWELQPRSPDPLRNLKNYCIICNTLCRKAAQRGGLHPLELDRLSGDFARRIEALSRRKQAEELLREMFLSYCRQVQARQQQPCSPLVQKALLCVREELGGDLSLKALAGRLSVSPGYLSAQFHAETGQTLTDYVNRLRLQEGARLLQETTLQVQAIAQHCGVSDVNYFSRMFKKAYGLTPREYRKKIRE